MSHNRPPIPVIVIAALIVLGTAGYFIWQSLAPSGDPALTASGTVEASETTIAPEMNGRVAELLVDEGDTVSTGEVLLRLDDTLLKAQRELAAASLDTARAASSTADATLASAQAQYDLALSAALNEQKSTRTANWTAQNPSEFNQPAWYFSQPEQIEAVESEAASAQANLDDAQANLKFVEEKATSRGFLDAEKRLAAARTSFQVAKDVLDKTNGASQDLRDAAQETLDDAKTELDDAQKAYEEAITTEGAADVLDARARLVVAQEHFDAAQDRLRMLQTGRESPKVVAAQKTVDQAKAAIEQAKSAASQAEANLALVDAQIAKLTITAPADGIVLTRDVEVGEVVNPGSVVLTIGNLNALTLTVYVPEDRYGEVSLGQNVDVTVDSFPGETFKATVIHIADKAEFTPRNVQTVEGRKTTVFAIKLHVDDPNGDLKAGMPADVTFMK
jgi:HlyD family secretion protein